MKLPIQTRSRLPRGPFCCILAVCLLFIVTGPSPPATAQNEPVVWRAEAEAGKTDRESFPMRNPCVQPHRFSVKISAKYLRFDVPTDSVLIAGGSIQSLGVLIDATGLKSQIYRSKIEIACLDCKPDKTCSLKTKEVKVELNVIASRAQSQLASEYQSLLNAELVRLNARVAPNAQPLLDEIIKHGASVFVETGDDTRKEEAFNNLKKFAEALVKYGEKMPEPPPGKSFTTRSRENEPVLITKKSVQKARAGVCPLFPFCG